MADIEQYQNGNSTVLGAGSNAAGIPAPVVMENVIDATLFAADAAIGETVLAMQIPAGMLVTGVVLKTIGPQPTVTLAVGDATDPDGWAVAGTIAAAGMRLGGGAYAAAPKLYTADTDLLLTVGAAALSTGVVKVYVVGFQLN